MIIKTLPDEIQNYLVDASNFHGECDAVYFPENAGEISEILHKANRDQTHVTISGNGTGLTGARVPSDGIVISTEKLNRIIEINKDEMFAIVEPAVILSEFQEKVKELGLMYPPDPTEKNCFIGGTVATNASGEKTFKYGPTRDYVMELEVLLANGEKLKLKRGVNLSDNYKLKLRTEQGNELDINIPDYEMPKTKNASGYFCKSDLDAIDLFIGSEGTLGVISKIKLKLVPLPESIISCVIFFDQESNALSFIEKARDISLNTKLRDDHRCIEALALEFFDGNALKFLSEDYPQIPVSAQAGVWFEQEVTGENEESFFECWMDLITEFHGDEGSAWFAMTDADKKKVQEFRHAVSVKVNDYISKNNFRKLGTDVAVPNNNFEEFYFYCKSEVEKTDLDFVTYGHFGNSHIHLNMLPKNEDEFKTGKFVYNKICQKAIEMGGTVSAEHGIGKIKTDYLIDMYGKENVLKMVNLKKSLDPNLILGVGTLFNKELFEN